jgi:hypothetical protein
MGSAKLGRMRVRTLILAPGSLHGLWWLVVSLRAATGSVLNPFEFEPFTLTIVLQQITPKKTTKSKFCIATSYAGLISVLGITSIIATKVPY